MNYAVLEDAKDVEAVFKQHRTYFPHIRHDYLLRRIKDHECIWDSGIVITYSIYKVNVGIGNVHIPAGSVMLHQIANKNPHNGVAQKVFQEFLFHVCHDRDLYLAVRYSNMTARHFYERQGMVIIGKVTWDGGKLDGVVYKLCSSKPKLFP